MRSRLYNRNGRSWDRDVRNSDPFAIDPIRRSGAIVAFSLATLIVPFTISARLGEGMMILVGWIAVTAIIFCVPILIWSLIEEGLRILNHRLHPSIDELRLSPRLNHLLRRYGYMTIRDLERASDARLLLLSNLDERDVHEVRRAVNLWRYARWQEQGFPAIGHD